MFVVIALLAVAIFKVFYLIGTIPTELAPALVSSERKVIVPRSACKVVLAFAANKDVAAITAIKRVLPLAANERVIAVVVAGDEKIRFSDARPASSCG